MKVFLLRVSDEGVVYQGYIAEFPNELRAMQDYVGGHIEHIDFGEIDVFFNEDGKNLELPLNRAWCDKDGRVLDILCGNILCCRHEVDQLTDILESDIEVITNQLRALDSFFEKEIITSLEERCPVYSETGK